MKVSAFILAVFSMVLAGCGPTSRSEDQVSPEIETRMKEVAEQQAKGLRHAATAIHRAFPYEGDTWIKPAEGARLIAVDAEFSGYTEDFDLDDIDIIDGATDDNYGSYPDVLLLDSNGEVLKNPPLSAWPEAPGPLRILLIYALPVETSTVKLGYWGDELTSEPTPIDGSGYSTENPNLAQQPQAE